MPQSDPSKTEKPTEKRIKKARDEGNVAKSQEVPKSLVILAGLLMLWMWLAYLGEDMKGLFRWFFTESFTFTASKDNIFELMTFLSYRIAKMVVPVMLVVGFVAFMANRVQVGPLWAPKVFNPKFDKIFNPANGLKRMMFNMQTLIRLGKSILQAIAIGVAPYVILKENFGNIAPLFYKDVHALAKFMLETAAEMVLWALLPMLAIAAFDLWYMRWDYQENLKMTKDEVKDERKQVEGDPEIKMQQKQKMMAVMARRMMQDVPKADVVITNPTHYAVALQYDASVAPAPIVLAKGVDHLAKKIKEIARENNVPIRENKPLARALYKSVEVGDAIPEEMYQAVATILSQLQKFKAPQANQAG